MVLLAVCPSSVTLQALLPSTARAVASPALSADAVFLATNEPALYAFDTVRNS